MRITVVAAMAAVALATSVAGAQMGMMGTKMVGGAEMFPTKNIIENAVNSKDHTTLVAAVKAAGLVDTLSGAGPFTVFAPTNAAFDKLPAGTVDTLLKPENKATLTKVLTYHVVAGKWDSAAVAKMIKDAGGKAEIKTVAGRQALGVDEGQGPDPDRREGRQGEGHDRRRLPVERRHPRDRHGRDAQVGTSRTS